jgi:hypothetical protein
VPVMVLKPFYYKGKQMKIISQQSFFTKAPFLSRALALALVLDLFFFLSPTRAQKAVDNFFL